MASSSIIAACRQRERYIHISAAIIPKGTVLGKNKNGEEIVAPVNLVARGTTYRKTKNETGTENPTD